MKIKATTPCYKFIDATSDEQQEKLLEEVLEVTNAWKVLNREYSYETLKSLLMELLDVKACVNTAIAQLELYVEKENYERSLRLVEASNANDNIGDTLTKIRQLNSEQIIFDCCLRDAKDAVVEKNLRRGYYLEDKEQWKSAL